MKNPLSMFLSEEASFEGEMRFKDSARIAGTFKGRIKGEGLLVIEATAKVKATVEVDELILLGELEGQVQAYRSAVLEPPARFIGKVSSPSLSIKEGVFFEGTSTKTKV